MTEHRVRVVEKNLFLDDQKVFFVNQYSNLVDALWFVIDATTLDGVSVGSSDVYVSWKLGDQAYLFKLTMTQTSTGWESTWPIPDECTQIVGVATVELQLWSKGASTSSGSYLWVSNGLIMSINAANGTPVDLVDPANVLVEQVAEYANQAQQSAEEAQQALEQLLGSGTTICYGQCNTAANTAAKVVSCQGFNLATGALIAVKFTNENTANYPTLNVNSTGAKSIYGHSNYPPVGTGTGVWKSNEVKLFVYDGTNFRIVGTSALELCGGTAVSITNGGTGVSNTSRLSFYGTCSTAANTAAKVVSCPDFSLAAGVRVAVKFTNSNTAANVTLNVNSTGAKNVYLYGTMRWTGTPWQAQEIVEFIYDGTNYQMLGKSHLAS